MIPNTKLCISHKQEYCAKCVLNIEDQYVFVKYYDIVGEQDVTKDGVDEKLKFVRLNWKGHGDEEEVLEQLRVYFYVPLIAFVVLFM